MQERLVSIDRETHALSPHFTVFATQNPIEYEGTYPLPEAQKDRFMLKITMNCPGQSEELDLAKRMLGQNSPEAALAGGAVQTVISADVLKNLRGVLEGVLVREELLGYVVEIVRRTRQHESVLVGAGPRATQALLLSSRAQAVLAGRDFVTPDDVKAMTLPVLEHRLILRPEFEIEGVSVAEVVQKFSNKWLCPDDGPGSRLLLWVGLVVLPFAVLWAAVPESTPLALAALVMLAILVSMDAALAYGSLRNVGVELPEVVRLSKDRPGAIELRIRNDSKKARRLRLGLALPRDLPSPDEDLAALLPDDVGSRACFGPALPCSAATIAWIKSIWKAPPRLVFGRCARPCRCGARFVFIQTC